MCYSCSSNACTPAITKEYSVQVLVHVLSTCRCTLKYSCTFVHLLSSTKFCRLTCTCTYDRHIRTYTNKRCLYISISVYIKLHLKAPVKAVFQIVNSSIFYCRKNYTDKYANRFEHFLSVQIVPVFVQVQKPSLSRGKGLYMYIAVPDAVPTRKFSTLSTSAAEAYLVLFTDCTCCCYSCMQSVYVHVCMGCALRKFY
eukprot:SAG31_NODE_1267_length_9068_cov_26.326346_7_plen_198_part_00